MNTIDKLASEIIAGYSDLTKEEKTIVDCGEQFTEDDNYVKKVYTRLIKNIPFFSINRRKFFYIKNHKDKQAIMANDWFTRKFAPDYGQSPKNINGKWWSGNGNAWRRREKSIYSTFKDIFFEQSEIEELVEALDQRYWPKPDGGFVFDYVGISPKWTLAIFNEIPDNVLESKAIQATSTNRSFEDLNEFFKYLKSKKSASQIIKESNDSIFSHRSGWITNTGDIIACDIYEHLSNKVIDLANKSINGFKDWYESENKTLDSIHQNCQALIKEGEHPEWHTYEIADDSFRRECLTKLYEAGWIRFGSYGSSFGSHDNTDYELEGFKHAFTNQADKIQTLKDEAEETNKDLTINIINPSSRISLY